LNGIQEVEGSTPFGSTSFKSLKEKFFSSVVDQFRRRLDRRTVQELGRSLALIVDREALEASLAARIREIFDPDRLILLEPDSAIAFRATLSFGLQEVELEAMPLAGGKLSRWLAVNETCFVVDRQPGVFEYLDPVEKELLRGLRLQVAVPMISLNRLTGILLLGFDRSSRVLSRRDLELLGLLARQASLAFENAALYREQRERLDRLHRAERLAAVGQLAAGVAHEIRNPLTAIRSTMQYLLQGLDPSEPKHQLVEELLSEVDRINSTVGGLLSLSRSGEFRPVAIDVLDPLARAVQLLRARAGEQGLEIAAHLPQAPVWVLGDAGQLKQVFLNLLLNAVQSMPGGGCVRVRVAPWAPPSEILMSWTEIRIADAGSGIPLDQLRRVFDPFFTTKGDGTGLGLAICHGIVEQHQGEIVIESEEGRGTTVSVRLPLAGGQPWPTS
jgi:signal transduction histidine kinase